MNRIRPLAFGHQKWPKSFNRLIWLGTILSFRRNDHIIAPAALMVWQQSSLIITPEWEYSSYSSYTIKPLQMIQNASARLVFNEPKRAHVTPLFISLHWLPVAARIKFKTLMLAYRTTTGSAPSYFHSLLRIYIPSRSLRSASERRLVVPSQRGSKSLSRTFSFTIPGWWNNPPTPVRNAGSLSIFKQQLKTHLFRHYLTFPLSFSPSLASLYLVEQWMRLGVTSTSSVWLPLQDESLYVFPNCKSLWIKASAKWLNVNVNVVPSHIGLENHNFSFSVGLSTQCNYRRVKL